MACFSLPTTILILAIQLASFSLPIKKTSKKTYQRVLTSKGVRKRKYSLGAMQRDQAYEHSNELVEPSMMSKYRSIATNDFLRG